MKPTGENLARYRVKRPDETVEILFVATLEEIKAGLKTGEIQPDWVVQKDCNLWRDGFLDWWTSCYWMTVQELIYGRPHPNEQTNPKPPLQPRPKSPPFFRAQRILKCAAVLFVASCLIPPWQFTADRNGTYGYHASNPAGYSLLFAPPINPKAFEWSGVRIDYGRLFLEWAALAAITGTVWLLVVKPPWLRDGKINHQQKSIPPGGNPKN